MMNFMNTMTNKTINEYCDKKLHAHINKKYEKHKTKQNKTQGLIQSICRDDCFRE